MELMVASGGAVYDISGSCTDISWTDTLNEGASSMEVSYIAGDLTVQNGDTVRLTENDQEDGSFLGSSFKVGGDESGSGTVKA